MKVGVLGLGYWGPNLIRNFLSNNQVTKVLGCDMNDTRLKKISERFPNVELSNDASRFVINPEVDVIAISLPVGLHFKFAKKALESGKHIWVEKPFTTTSQEAESLIELAEKKNLRIFVDHTFIYTGAVQKIKEIVDKDILGDILYFDSVRVNLGLFQSDVNVIWDLAPHDLSIMDFVLGKKVVAITANGIANYSNRENVAHISVYFKDNCFAHFHVNWTSPVKIRKMILGGTKKMLVFDDMENFEKIKVYDSGIELNDKDGIYNALVQYRIGDMYSPKVSQIEALALGVKEFICSINQERNPITSGKDGLAIVKILEAAEKSIKNNGQIVEIN